MNLSDCRLDDFIFPLFVYENENAYKQSLKSGYMNESKIYHKRLVESLEHLISLDISQILLFGIPKERNQNGDFSSLQDANTHVRITAFRVFFKFSFT